MKVAALSGGVGGARLMMGLANALDPENLTIVVNTGDDFDHWGLRICPDLDTVMYALAGLSPICVGEQGWGLRGDTFRCLQGVQRYGGESWFQLGDQDLSTHITRTAELKRKKTLTEVTTQLRTALGVRVPILPMSDGPCGTVVRLQSGDELPFQEWLVRRRAEPALAAVITPESALATPEVERSLAEADAIILGPSNPYVSIDPILSRPNLRNALHGKPVLAVSPLVGGKPVKGPLDRMIRDLTGKTPSTRAIAEHYSGILSGLVVESGDKSDELFHLPLLETSTLIRDLDASQQLARTLLEFLHTL